MIKLQIIMSSACEKCPISKKIACCCGSNPETGETKTVKIKKTGQKVTACKSLGPDGSCLIYDERPEDCGAYVCEEIYAMGLGFD